MRFVFILVPVIFFYLRINGQEIPLGYIIQYQQDFDQMKNYSEEFTFRDSISAGNNLKPGNKYMVVDNGDSDMDSSVSNLNCILSGYILADFIIRIDLKSRSAHSNSYTGFCFCIKDTSDFYELTFTSADHENFQCDVYSIRNGERKRISSKCPGIIEMNAKWNTIIIRRDLVQGTISIFLENEKQLICKVKDRTFVMGYIGFSGKQSRLFVDDLVIWGPTSIIEKRNIFN